LLTLCFHGSNIEETLTLALVLSVLVGLPLISHKTIDFSAWIKVRLRLFSCFTSVDLNPDAQMLFAADWPSLAAVSVAVPALGALVGAWAGAIALPLDWDRWWQVCDFGWNMLRLKTEQCGRLGRCPVCLAHWLGG
jgi:hypothetical protein